MLKKIAKEVEVIIDDDEGLTSVSFTWDGPGGYFIVTDDPESDKIYYELEDQSNGTYVDNIKYSIDEENNEIVFTTEPHSTFIRNNQGHELKIALPANAVLQPLKDAMQVITCGG